MLKIVIVSYIFSAAKQELKRESNRETNPLVALDVELVEGDVCGGD